LFSVNAEIRRSLQNRFYWEIASFSFQNV